MLRPDFASYLYMKSITVKGRRWSSYYVFRLVDDVKMRIENGITAAKQGMRAKGSKSSADVGRDYKRLKHGYEKWKQRGMKLHIDGNGCRPIELLSGCVRPQWQSNISKFDHLGIPHSFPVRTLQINSSLRDLGPIWEPLCDLSHLIIDIHHDAIWQVPPAWMKTPHQHQILPAILLVYHRHSSWENVQGTINEAARFGNPIMIQIADCPHAFCTHVDAQPRHPLLKFKTCHGVCGEPRTALDTLCKHLAGCLFSSELTEHCMPISFSEHRFQNHGTGKYRRTSATYRVSQQLQSRAQEQGTFPFWSGDGD